MMKAFILLTMVVLSSTTSAGNTTDYVLGDLVQDETRSLNELTTADSHNNTLLDELEGALLSDWQVGSFGSCSKSCGTGYQYRTVDCPAGFICEGAAPADSRVCNTHSCTLPVSYWACSSGGSLSGTTCTRANRECRNPHYTGTTLINIARAYDNVGYMDGVNPGNIDGRIWHWDGQEIYFAMSMYGTPIRTFRDNRGATYTRGALVNVDRHYAHGKLSWVNYDYQICKNTTVTYGATPVCPSGYRYNSSSRNCTK